MSGKNLSDKAIAILLMSSAFSLQTSTADCSEGPRIVDGSKVTLSYHITVPGERVDIQDVGQFVQGRHEILPALEREVNGLKMGDEKHVTLSKEEGFGPYDANNKTTVPRSALPDGIHQGDVIQDRTGKPATVTHLSDTSADIDFNHPLAGKPLRLDITILQVDNSSPP